MSLVSDPSNVEKWQCPTEERGKKEKEKKRKRKKKVCTNNLDTQLKILTGFISAAKPFPIKLDLR